MIDVKAVEVFLLKILPYMVSNGHNDRPMQEGVWSLNILIKQHKIK